MRQVLLTPTKARPNRKSIFGFDIETYGQKNKFYCGSLYGDNIIKTFYDKRELIDFLKTRRFKNSIIAATNLQFDFNGTFFKEPEIKSFFPCYRGSDLIFSKAFTDGKEFYMKREKKNDKTITFIDTLNYAKLSVDNIGKILGIPKLKTPEFIGRMPKTPTEKMELTTYNIRDAEISQKFVKFLFDSFENLGASPKNTIASTSMSLFKNKYLDRIFIRHDFGMLLEEFNAYYGGRVEAFYRGLIEDYNYYDVNSLYPYCMTKDFPNPNTIKVSSENNIKFIDNFDGVSHVDIYAPPMDICLLPYRTRGKLIFPHGNFSGWYSNVELRKALELGYVIKKVRKSIYSKENIFPFRDFVLDLYSMRKDYKDEGSPMQLVVKLLLNSLYGKFGQKFVDREQIIPIPESLRELRQYDNYEFVGEFLRIKKKYSKPRPFCIPLFALYTTSYGRLKLFDYLKRSNPVYCDTDSIITKKEFESSQSLGKLKLEMKIKRGVIVKPKFYGVIDELGKEHIRVKGVGVRLDYKRFKDFLSSPIITYDKFMKFKESIRRNLTPNEILPITKNLSLEDDKREWEHVFNTKTIEKSLPIKVSTTGQQYL